ncbi:hypothetical protein [Draconibacterium mangrovi]|uniref:hypothetical protein n=1 Tax=Draconibacterium mangrovi TaxID=2697469 RepID=UPI0013D5FCA1|nr:hypothetical protein [Draconibacterium mangrovi]
MPIANTRLEAAMILIDERTEEYNKKFKKVREEHGDCVAPKKRSEIIAEVAEETFYNEKTLMRKHNDWMKNRGVFENRAPKCNNE